MAQNIQHIAQAHLGRHRQPVSNVVVAVAKARYVAEQYQHLYARLFGPSEQVFSQGVFGRIIQLKPRLTLGDLGDALYASGRNRTQNKRQVVGGRGLGQQLGRPGPDESLKANGRDPKGHAVAVPEKSGL